MENKLKTFSNERFGEARFLQLPSGIISEKLQMDINALGGRADITPQIKCHLPCFKGKGSKIGTNRGSVLPRAKFRMGGFRLHHCASTQTCRASS